MSTLSLRKSVCSIFVLTYAIIGIPLWGKLTNIYRAPLPREYIKSLNNDKFFDVHVTIPVYIKSDVYKFPDIHEATQIQVNHLLDSKKQNVQWSLEILQFNDTFIELEKEQGREYHIVTLQLDEFVGYNAAYDSKNTVVYFDDPTVARNDLPFFVAQTLVEHTFNVEWGYLSNGDLMLDKHSAVAINYNPDIHLSINLLKGDGSPVDWEIEETLKTYFTPFRRFLSPLVNFTVDTSVVYFNDLNLHSLNNTGNITWTDVSHTIDLSELSSMNYFSEDSALNLAIVFPSKETNPEGFSFVKAEGEQTWESFIVPQWGVLVINKMPLEANTMVSKDYLDAVLYKFANDLFELLGLTTESESLFSPVITIDSFKRIRTLQNINKSVETLWSLIKLTEQFQQMAIPKDVLENVKEVLDTRLDIVEILNNPAKGDDLSWDEALNLSNKMVQRSEEAFFDGQMLKQNFFPQEHKLAVYMPLIGPITIVLFTGFISLFKETEPKLIEKEKSLTEEEKKEVEETEAVGAIEGEDEIN
ncbi:similar to Saccharomyces cerevisiae YDR434W GPI17 Transmembrane protein subunit of the glycosylphosphatidylinositol transamidase complex that adds GPIs to newly synthesized proteins [Maudiozyma saulgeensis]|uniref:Similar to Saccharomyces cerevisiae YDR434W GPI17 Transmembrane protein subunit of the glycosylphosphatidylinositol transamidase complex that adds GPIs to newly synthesized proteins n=1 Tax=Maudiozyma saulgeensis TaxID=1789683 RepID=A0A1X7R1U0_9SACH|nr:similar to Saccharomyces cerevisiae YDR434W GPI17 Transmembrane protein subunit of the glycosylphosphatidylinositol transamidase complex that adds GPIs to newly synthesized proteins [Kazachstania saulgeensis]